MRFSLRSMLRSVTMVALLFCAGRFIYLSAFGPIIPYAVLDTLKPGMSQAQVEEILGPPAQVYDGEWHYERGLNPGWVEIQFYDQGRYSGFNDEGVFP